MRLSPEVDTIYRVPIQRLYANTPQVTNEAQVPWGLDRIDQVDGNLDGLYTYRSTGQNVHVYIIDSGIRRDHSEFLGRIHSAKDFVDSANGGEDKTGHGTAVAAAIGGTKVGVAKGVFLHIVRVFDTADTANADLVATAILFVAENHESPAVLNYSGGGDPNSVIDSRVAYAVSKGVTVVVAAGNDPVDACQGSPARDTAAVITVGASNINDNSAGFAYGPCVEIYAPGDKILSAASTGADDWAPVSGTSIATPYVTGVAAQFLETHQTATPRDVRRAILGAATRTIYDSEGGSAHLLYTNF
jgi:subtilisin family serine protease